MTSVLRRLAQFSDGHALELLEDLAAVSLVASLNPSKNLTAEQESALREAGSLVEEMPPANQRASTFTLLQAAELLTHALTTSDVATNLDVSPGRVRQRAADRTLYSVEGPRERRFPRFQFNDSGKERDNWDRVLPSFPEDIHPVALHHFMFTPHTELASGDLVMSPTEWLETGGSVEHVLVLASDAYSIL